MFIPPHNDVIFPTLLPHTSTTNPTNQSEMSKTVLIAIVNTIDFYVDVF